MNTITGQLENAVSSRVSGTESRLKNINNSSSFETHLYEARKISKEAEPGTKSPVHKKLW